MKPRHHDRAGARQAGFTLVELLVAMTLLGFLTVLLFGGLRLGTRTWERSQQSYADEKALLAASSFLAANIAQAYPLRVRDKSNRGGIAFEGHAQALSWISAAPTGNGGMTRLRLFQDGGNALEIARADELSPPATANVSQLVDGIDMFDIQYYGRRGEEQSPHWGGDWHGQPRLPSLIRIRMRMQDRRAVWPDLIVAPRLAGNAGCILDALTNRCGGQ